MLGRVDQRADRDAGDVVNRWRRVLARPARRHREHAHLRRVLDQAHVRHVGEEAGVDDRQRRVGQHGEQPIGQPVLARRERRVLRVGEPLAQRHDRLQPRLARGGGERRRALDHVGIERRQEVAALHAAHRVEQRLRIGEVADRDLRARRLQRARCDSSSRRTKARTG